LFEKSFHAKKTVIGSGIGQTVRNGVLKNAYTSGGDPVRIANETEVLVERISETLWLVLLCTHAVSEVKAQLAGETYIHVNDIFLAVINVLFQTSSIQQEKTSIADCTCVNVGNVTSATINKLIPALSGAKEVIWLAVDTTTEIPGNGVTVRELQRRAGTT